MGGCFSISVPCDQVVNQASRWLCLKGSYIHNLPKNLESLKKAMIDLKAKRDDVQTKVVNEEYTGLRRRLAQVQVWLTDILAIEDQYNDILSTSEDELKRLCLCGFCSKDFKSSYGYGERIILILREVERLSSKGEFDVLTEAVPIAEVEELPIQPNIVGQETMLETVWKLLMDGKVGIVGLYGMGGVGKTTLLTQINNKLSENHSEIDTVIWVVVSKNATVHAIQKGIGRKLGLSGKEWDEKDEHERALDIHNRLKRKRFVLLLDDIWEDWDLVKIGVPRKINGSKVAFTTRSREVCGRMGVHHPIEVRCLDSEKAWDLFKQNVGEDTLGSHPDIPELAREVAKKCCGLPLALTVIGKAMASKSAMEEWKGALDVLTSTASDFSEMEDKILPILKYSYDGLDGEHVKSCFLYCSMFPEDSLIDKKRLIEYWIGEGFLDVNEGREKAYNQGYGIIGTLLRSCLLMEDEDDKSEVKMHDVVRDMALWIASDLGKHKEGCIVQGGLGLREVPKVKDWRTVRRLSLMKNNIEKISESVDCPELTTLLLRGNGYLKTISGEFFRSMPRLLVLDLSNNRSLNKLPEEISELVSLRYLDLSDTNIEGLPVGLQKLKMIIHLNLKFTDKLKNLEGISNLVSLRTLILRNSSVYLDMSLMKELQLLQHLEFVSVNISSSLVVEELLYNSTVGKCIQGMYIEELSEESVRVINLSAVENLRELYIRECKMWEIKIQRRGWNKILTSPCLFSNLSNVDISRCGGLKDLTWLLFAPNLSRLCVFESKELKEIISEEKAESFLEKETRTILPFQKLEYLRLSNLPKLKSIYWNALLFQRLRALLFIRCPKLRKLPLDSKSVGKVEDLDIKYNDEEWKERVEWVDEATRQRFLPKFRILDVDGM